MILRSKSAKKGEPWRDAVAAVDASLQELRGSMARQSADEQQHVRDAEAAHAKLATQVAEMRNIVNGVRDLHAESRQADRASAAATIDEVRDEMRHGVREVEGRFGAHVAMLERAGQVDCRLQQLGEQIALKEVETQRLVSELREWVAERLADMVERISAKAEQRVVEARFVDLREGFLEDSTRHREMMADQVSRVTRVGDARAESVEAQLEAVQRHLRTRPDSTEFEQFVQSLKETRSTLDGVMKEVQSDMDKTEVHMKFTKAELEAVHSEISSLRDECMNMPGVNTDRFEAEVEEIRSQLSLKADTDVVNTQLRTMVEGVEKLREQSSRTSDDLRQTGQRLHNLQMRHEDLHQQCKATQPVQPGAKEEAKNATSGALPAVKETQLALHAVITPRGRRGTLRPASSASTQRGSVVTPPR